METVKLKRDSSLLSAAN